ncbi:hypothetical protein Tco_0778498 [Tanacetum coccineum]
METQPNDQDHLVNYDNDNDNDDLGYESKVYLNEEGEDGNNHSDGNVVKRGITRLSKFRREYGKPNGIKLSVTFDALNRISGSHRALFSSFLADLVCEHIGLKILSWKKVGSEARDKLWDEITQYFDVDLTVRKLIENKEIKPDEEPPRGILWLKGRVNKDGQFPDDEIRSVGDKLKETEDKIKEGTLKVDHGTNAMTVVLGKEKGGYARGVGSGVTYKRYFELPQSRQVSDERIMLLQSQLDNERREREQLQSMSTKLSPSDVSLVDINPIDSSADKEGGTRLSVVGCENDASIQKSNGLATLEKEMETRTILMGLPEDIYATIDSFETAQEIWLRVQQMMKGSAIGAQEKKAKLFNEWESFTSTDGESNESYYHSFSKLMHDFKRNKHFSEKIASNLKFLNNLQLEWKRHITIIRQTKDFHQVEYTQLYDFLKMNQEEVNELRAERQANTHDPLTFMAKT